jgi:hypothetical protein
VERTAAVLNIGAGQTPGGVFGGFFTVADDGNGQDWGWGSNSDSQIFRPHVWPAGQADYSAAIKDNFFYRQAVFL